MSNASPVYRALFPPHFTPRTNGRTDIDSARQFTTLELPRIRLMGILWSFGINVRCQQSNPGSASGQKTPSLRLLYEQDKGDQLSLLNNYAMPILLRAEIEGFLQPESNNMSSTRLSVLAVDTIEEKIIENGRIKKVLASELGFTNGTKPTKKFPIIVAPFGGQPPPTADKTRSFLPAMQLIHGRIRYKADKDYLRALRPKLGLHDPKDTDLEDTDSNEIVLLPDGFCLKGKLKIPWMQETSEEISGWFKATIQGNPDKKVELRGLTPWIDPDSSSKDGTWNDVARNLEDLLRKCDEAKQPHWLQLAPNAPILPEHLFWPEEKPSSPLLGSIDQNTVWVNCPGLNIRLSDSHGGSGSLSTLTIQSDKIVIKKGEESSITLYVNVNSELSNKGILAEYKFSSSASGSENISFTSTDNKTIPLAIPMIETADTIRRAAGLPTPQAGQDLSLLWTFTPIANGWLHWPLPNATPGNLARLLVPNTMESGKETTSAETDNTTETSLQANQIAGALIFGNHPHRKNYRPDQRSWGFSLGSATNASATITLDTSNKSITKATVNLFGGEVSCDGFFLVTPFAQTSERLLPDHNERALRTIGLRAVSPSLLRGIEQHMWQQNEPKKQPKVVIEATLSNFKINAGEEGLAEVENSAEFTLTTVCRSPEPEEGSWLKADAMQPWVWVAHGQLPTIQSLPLAVAGSERTNPSGVRSLAPLMIESSPKTRLCYTSKPVLNTLSMDITITGDWDKSDELNKATFILPGSASRQWREEISMAITTLPTVSLVVGEKNAAGLALENSNWGGFPQKVVARFRHDLALRDERYALTKAPGAPSSSPAGNADNMPFSHETVFSPLPGNGPDNRPLLKVDEKSHKVYTNGWDRIRLELNRRAALAALEGRTMLSEGENSWSLEGILGEQSYQLNKAPTLEESVIIDPDTKSLVSIGNFSFDINNNGVKQTKFTLAGLPAESDLVGLTGTFKRGDSSINVRFGVAEISSDNTGRFNDQSGLKSLVPQDSEAMIIRTIIDTANENKEIRLLTLCKPITVSNAGKATFWCADVPVVSDINDKFLAQFGAGKDEANLLVRANGTSRQYNHLAGFRWFFGDNMLADPFVIVDGLVFEPMELACIVQSGFELPTSIKMLGRLRVPVSAQPHRPPAARGIVALTLEKNNDSDEYSAKLGSEGELVLHFADPDSHEGMIPIVTLKSLPAPDKTTNGELQFAFGDQIYTVQVNVSFDHNNGFKIDPEVTVDPEDKVIDHQNDGKDQIKLTSLTAKLPAAKQDNNSIKGETDASATIQYKIKFGQPGAYLKGNITYDLVNQKTEAKDIKHIFTNKSFVNASVNNEEISFDRSQLLLRWTAETTKPKPRLLGGLEIESAVGVAFVALKPETKVDKVEFPLFTVSDRRLRATFNFPGDHDKIELSLDDLGENGNQPRKLGYRLKGKLQLTNALTWPEVDVKNDTEDNNWLKAQFSVYSDSTPSFGHEVTLLFDGQAISPESFDKHDRDKERIPLMVEALHLVKLTNDTKSLSWRSYQVVWLSSAKVFAKALYDRVRPGKPFYLKTSRTGYSPIAGEKKDQEYRFAPHIFHAAFVESGGIAGDLAEKIKTAIKNSDCLAVEFSNHVLLAFDSANPKSATLGKLTAAPLLLGLPGFGLWEIKIEKNPFDDDDELKRMLASRPKKKQRAMVAGQ